MPAIAGSDASPWPADAIEVGRIVGAWGVSGWIKVQPFASNPQALFATRRWLLEPPQEPIVHEQRATPALLTVLQAREHGGVIVAQARQVRDRDAAQALRGSRVFVGRSSFPAPGADEFYWVDLIGLAVTNRQGESLGAVAGLLDTGAQSVLRVAPAARADAGRAEPAEERLIPFVAAYVDSVDLERRLITVDWGLDF